MTQLIVDEAQARLIRETEGTLEIRDQNGRALGYLVYRASEEDIELARQRLASDEPRLSTAEVLAHLQSLESK